MVTRRPSARRASACRPPRSATRSTRACAHRKRREHKEVVDQAARNADDDWSCDDRPRDDRPRDDRPRDDRRASACRPPRSATRSTRACAHRHRKRREHEEVVDQAATKTDDELSRDGRPLVRTNPSRAAHAGSGLVGRSQPPVFGSVSAAGRARGTHARTRAGQAH